MRYCVYEYGCRPPLAGEEVALEQMRRRVEFWNALFAIEQQHISRTREVLAVPATDERIGGIKKEISDLAADVKTRSKGRSAAGSAELRDLRSRIELLKVAMTSAVAEAKQLRRTIVDERRADLTAIDNQRKAAVKAARGNAGLYWCNADEVIALYERARIAAMKSGASVGSREWRGTGRVSVKYQNGLSPSLLPTDTRFQIDPVDPTAWSDPRRHIRRRLCRTVARIRVGSNETRQPIWLELPIVMHRPIPSDVLIRAVSVKRFRVGTQFRYKLLIVVREPSSDRARRADKQARAVGVAISLGRCNEGIRIGYWIDDAGETGELLLPTAMVSQFDKVNELRSRLDTNWNTARTELAAWIAQSSVLPDWFRDATRELQQWTDYHRPLALLKLWKTRRFSTDELIFPRLLKWRRGHVHLYSWASNLRDQVQMRRREHYRIIARDMAGRYGYVFLSSSISMISPPPSKPPTNRSSNRAVERYSSTPVRAVAAPGLLQRTLLQTCEREAVEVHTVPIGTRMPTCPACKTIALVQSGETLSVCCQACSQSSDAGLFEAAGILGAGLNLLNKRNGCD